jgi:hypothetical protein
MCGLQQMTLKAGHIIGKHFLPEEPVNEQRGRVEMNGVLQLCC